MASELYTVIETISHEKGINPEVVVAAVEDAMVVATRKFYKTQDTLRAVLDRDTGAIRAYSVHKIVADDDALEDEDSQITLEDALKISPDAVVDGELLQELSTQGLGRIAAQLAKQVIFQKVREAERDTVFNEYASRVGEIINATLKRQEGQDIIFDIGKAEARMPRKEQSRLESFAAGERVRVVIVRVDKESKGPAVIVSRAAPELVSHLFQTEVPEIYDGTVIIRAIAREAGERTKIAVMSKDKDVDAVGACVGMKGMRVQSIIRELRGEKIDIIEFHDDAVGFAEKALQPAKVSRVSILSATDKHLEVIVDDSQLSLAIGKKGQNVRLAAKLLGWKIDIKSEEEKRQEVEQQMNSLVGPSTPLSKLGMDAVLLASLEAGGVSNVEQLADMTPEDLEAIEGIDAVAVENIAAAVNGYFAKVEEASAAAAAASETSKAEEAETPAVAETEDAEAVEAEAVEDEAETEADDKAESVEADAEPVAEEAAPEVAKQDEKTEQE